MNEELQAFYEDMNEQLGIMEDTLMDMLDLPVEDIDDQMVNALFRAMHTMKGNSGMFGFDQVVAFAHVAENLLDEIRNGAVKLTEELNELFLLVNDHSRTLVELSVNGEAMDGDQKEHHKELIDQLSSHLNRPDSPAPDSPPPGADQAKASGVYRIRVRLKEEFFSSGMDFLEILKFLDVVGDIFDLTLDVDNLPAFDLIEPVKAYVTVAFGYKTDEPMESVTSAFEFVENDIELEVRALDIKDEDKAKAPKSAPAAGKGNASGGGGGGGGGDKRRTSDSKTKSQNAAQATVTNNLSLRVDSTRVDLLINQISEMVINNAKITQQVQDLGHSDLEEAVVSMSEMLEEVRNGIMNIRMVPVGKSFLKFRRIVSDLEKKMGKQVNFEIQGGDTELDKTVIEKISDPLVHMLRNAVDHGIETPREREAAGKDPTGSLVLSAYPDAGTIVIEIRDDGRGLNRDTILAKAIERGMVRGDAHLNDAAVFNLIFEPGFSTAEKVSDVSGRGVGMDVVKRNIEELRSTIEIESELGKGTLMTIRLPLTLAIIDGFLVQVGDTKYIIPLESIQECLALTKKQRLAMKEDSYINLRGSALPLLDAKSYFKVGAAKTKKENIVVVSAAGHKAGLIVDELYGEFQTVIKPLGDVFKMITWLSGGTILGSGEVALILDIPMLLSTINYKVQETSNVLSKS